MAKKPDKQLRLVMSLSVIVGLSLTAQYGMSATQYLGESVFPPIVGRIVATTMFWGAFVLMIIGVKDFTELFLLRKGKKQIAVLASLGLVVAIAHVGQFALKGLEFYRAETILPDWLLNTIIIGLFWLAFAYVIAGIYIWKKM